MAAVVPVPVQVDLTIPAGPIRQLISGLAWLWVNGAVYALVMELVAQHKSIAMGKVGALDWVISSFNVVFWLPSLVIRHIAAGSARNDAGTLLKKFRDNGHDVKKIQKECHWYQYAWSPMECWLRHMLHKLDTDQLEANLTRWSQRFDQVKTTCSALA